ncbi:MAG TPA: hypothetical protein VKR29_11340 [Candidatus Binataceae bacterium]|nr:hypothetical protein [Candidatus Binataceae bacterium]
MPSRHRHTGADACASIIAVVAVAAIQHHCHLVMRIGASRVKSETCTQKLISVTPDSIILGIDVGEDYLDLAKLSCDRAPLSYHRIALAELTRPITDALARIAAEIVGPHRRGAIALVDSPRSPRDLDCSGASMVDRKDAPATRTIDASLRELLRITFDGAMRPLSMFPTPPASYFAECVEHEGCKPHLRAIAEELLGLMPEVSRAKIAGGTFTRFMLAGFAVFPALEKLGIRAFEAYPDLQMRLWSDGEQIPPKRNRAEALRVRTIICRRLASIVGVKNFVAPTTLDEADAAVLALSAAASASTNSLLELRCAPEGRFAVALDKSRSGGLQR